MTQPDNKVHRKVAVKMVSVCVCVCVSDEFPHIQNLYSLKIWKLMSSKDSDVILQKVKSRSTVASPAV